MRGLAIPCCGFVDKTKRIPGDQPFAWPKAEEASHGVREYLVALDAARGDEDRGGDGGGSGLAPRWSERSGSAGIRTLGPLGRDARQTPVGRLPGVRAAGRAGPSRNPVFYFRLSRIPD